MTLVEFLAPIKTQSQNRDRILAILYYKQRYESIDSLTVEQIRDILKRTRVPRWSKINVADVLAKSGYYVDSPGTVGSRRLWKITTSGSQFVRRLLNLPDSEPEIEHDVGSLSSVALSINDTEIKDYVEEAIKCLQVGALRACVVFLWTGAIRSLHKELLSYSNANLNSAIQKHDPKARRVTKVDDFAYVKDKIVLLASFEIGLLDKSEKDTLEDALNLRNRCGHPGNYKPGVKKVSSFIEDVVSILFN